MKTKTITHTVRFPVPPKELYALFLDSKAHSKVTGGEARMSKKEGGRWTAFDGWASGRNVKLVEGRRIVQTWRGADWPVGHHSRFELAFKKDGKGSVLVMTHSDVPSTLAKDVADGWRTYYWKPMKAYLMAGRKSMKAPRRGSRRA